MLECLLRIRYLFIRRFEHGAVAAFLVALENSFNYRLGIIDPISQNLHKLYSKYFVGINVEVRIIFIELSQDLKVLMDSIKYVM